MCVSPITIKNPNKGSHSAIALTKDVTSDYIRVPCGHCSECIKVRQMDYVQRMQSECRFNQVFFSTLTYNNSSLPYLDVNDRRIRYANIRDVTLMIHRFRKSNTLKFPFRYFAVSELGSKRGRPHFHILWFIPKKYLPTFEDCLNYQKFLFDTILLNWRRNYGSTRVPDYRPLCTYKSKFLHGKLYSNYDTHYVNPSLTSHGTSNVCWYVLKYMIKPSDRAVNLQRALRLNLDPDEYSSTWNVVKPRIFKSLGFGLNSYKDWTGTLVPDRELTSFLHGNFQKHFKDFPYPVYVNEDGNTFPLSRYYKKCSFVYSADEHLKLFNSNPHEFSDGTFIDDRHLSELQSSVYHSEQSFKQADSDVFDDLNDFLYE